MRELKFRIWDKQNKTFVKDPTRYQRLAISCDGRGVYSGKYDDCVKDRYIIQQYTGLQDSNGKEIYEGDILKYQSHNPEATKVLVRWTDESHDNHPGWIITDNYSQYGKPEVIGNIFETPELLK